MCYICVKKKILSVLFLFRSFVVDIFLSIEDVYKNTTVLMVPTVRIENLLIEEILERHELRKIFFFLFLRNLVIKLDLNVDFSWMMIRLIVDDHHIVEQNDEEAKKILNVVVI